MIEFDTSVVGVDWLVGKINDLTESIPYVDPVSFVEANRYLPASVTPLAGPFRFKINPFMRDILNDCDVNSIIREITLMKGVQITYSTLLECIIMYFAAYIKTAPMAYVSADKELAQNRIENNVIPMLQHSDMEHIIKSTDLFNTKKTGKTKHHIQFDGGGRLMPLGGRNADKMRDMAILLMLKDELDGWPLTVGRDGCPDKLTDDRCAGYSRRRKIFRGSTPNEKATSKIYKAYLRGDQRKYHVRCRACSFPQQIRWSGTNAERGHDYGFAWELDRGVLIPESVRWRCLECGHPHYEQDKQRLYDPDEGAGWVPTARPKTPFIRSYHLPGLYSPIGMRPWFENVADYLDCYDPVENRVIDFGKYKVFYNNSLGEPFEVRGAKITRANLSPHKRPEYEFGTVPNGFATAHTGGPVQFLTCAVDVHKHFLAVAVFGWTRGPEHNAGGYRCFVVDYQYLRDDSEDGLIDPDKTSHVWAELQHMIEERAYTSDDGIEYPIRMTLIDANFEQDLVSTFCARYDSGVYPIIGRDRPTHSQRIREFDEWTTKSGLSGYRVIVDYYKDRIAPVLRREWSPGDGPMKSYHFSTAKNTTDKMLDELTKETRVLEELKNGEAKYTWKRPSGARNELWDLLVYGHASVEIIAWAICIGEYDQESIDWDSFWDHIESGG